MPRSDCDSDFCEQIRWKKNNIWLTTYTGKPKRLGTGVLVQEQRQVNVSVKEKCQLRDPQSQLLVCISSLTGPYQGCLSTNPVPLLHGHQYSNQGRAHR